jgi:hypothetical protein
MVHSIAEFMWTPFVDVVAYGTAAYVLVKGLIATLRDVVDFLILLLS